MRNIFLKSSTALAIALTVVGCSDDFLAEKRPYGNFSYDEVYHDMTSVNLRLNYIYQKSLPYAKSGSNTTDNYYPDLWPVGFNDALSQNDDEFTGYGIFNDPSKTYDFTNVPKFFYYGTNESPWKKMRECTDVIEGVYNCEGSTLTLLQKQQSESQARFFRATRYYRLWKRFGGTPIVRTTQSTLVSDTTELRIPRQTTKATFDFMIEDLTYAAQYLPAVWDEEANDWGRITSGAALSLAGIIANYYASPIFNRSDDVTRWQQAYDLNKQALEKLAEGGFGLAYENNPGVNAENWARIWGNVKMGDGAVSEAVFVKICNNAVDDKNFYNGWEQAIRPSNAGGSASISPSAELIDAFPMADGKRPGDATGKYVYDKNSVLFFMNRDPRFYRTFAFPGTEWAFVGRPDTTFCPFQNGIDYQLRNFAWYETEEDASDSLQSGYYTDKLGSKGKTVYVRKKSLDANLGVTSFMNYDNDNYFNINAQPLLAIRYTEVLLNFAEAACGCNKLDEAWDVLVRIRKRVGYTDDCGLDPAIKSDRAKMFSAILYERQIELAYEGKRFDDCHRWMLFDGGVGQDSICSTWGMKAWNGNTCDYLGVTPLNEVPRHSIEICFNPQEYIGKKSEDVDPISDLGDSYPKSLTLSENFTSTYDEATATTTYANAAVQKWVNFYQTYMIRKNVVTMASTSERGSAPIWFNNYYFMCLEKSEQNNNPNVAQTIGWMSTFGGPGTFDPLAE